MALVLGDFLQKKRIDSYERISKDILKNINYNHPHKIDIYELCDLYGMKVLLSLIPDDTSYAVSHKKGRRGVINLTVCENEKEERETLAHEFSHLYLHQMNQLTQIPIMVDKMEIQAFKLASNILMPSSDILNFEVYPDINTAYLLAEDIAQYFNVTPEFAYRRLLYFNENHKFNINEKLELPNLSILSDSEVREYCSYDILTKTNNRYDKGSYYISTDPAIDMNKNKIIVIFNESNNLELK
ncbi:ImmA/IrrE family metallo-endopeptidase [Lysinibacillus sp. NPDC047702]|uniref:ImmA/IrrE family metallo-endopeptidase n=1 Tax=unclassified Lysinibacillus TaxID=2636778 RepID=UPI003D05A37D